VKISKSQLKQIIKEELTKIFNEEMPRRGALPGETGRARPQGDYDSGYDTWSEMAKAMRSLMKDPSHVFNIIIDGTPSPEELNKAANLYKKMWERYGGHSRSSKVGGTTIERVLSGVNNEDRPEGNQEFIEHIKNMSQLNPKDYQTPGVGSPTPDFIYKRF
tara:strand:+ start:78 stop:560 length:483 start_codon:yes stop_codon:yes gene_type:complete